MKSDLPKVQLEVLDWPAWWKGPGAHFTQGFPIFGVQAQIARLVTKMMAKRTSNDCERAWGDSGIDRDIWHPIIGKIHKAVSCYLSLPNGFYFPEDKCALALGIIPGVWYDVEDVVRDVKEAGSFEHIKYYEIVQDGVMSDLIKVSFG